MKNLRGYFLLCSIMFLFSPKYSSAVSDKDSAALMNTIVQLKAQVEFGKGADSLKLKYYETKMHLDSVQYILNHPVIRNHLNNFELFLVLLPVLLTLCLVFWVVKVLWKLGYNLMSALSDNRLLAVKDKDGKVVTTQQVHINSSSRLLAFLSGMATIVFVITMLSYCGYVVLLGREVPDFSRLWTIVAGLGFGVLPYGFNRFGKKADSDKEPTSMEKQ